MRRRNGTELVDNEKLTLSAALRCAGEGEPTIHGYRMFELLCRWAGSEPMNHGTLYRCLRSLEVRGYLHAETVDGGGRPRVEYQLTASGVDAARTAAIQLAAAEHSAWLDLPRLLSWQPTPQWFA